jgi:hypothetical protein
MLLQFTATLNIKPEIAVNKERCCIGDCVLVRYAKENYNFCYAYVAKNYFSCSIRCAILDSTHYTLLCLWIDSSFVKSF